MTATAFTLTLDNTSDATFRTWVSALDTQILALGWVHSTDTGQLNLTTGTRSATAGANYIIYKTNDGGTPIFAKFEFIGQSTTIPGFVLSVGYATDGAGNLTGTLQTSRWIWGSTNHPTSDTTARNCIISGGTGRMVFALCMNATNIANSILISVERSKDGSGNDTNTAALVTMAAGGTSANFISAGGTGGTAAAQYLPSTGTATPSVEMLLPCIVSNSAAGSSAFGTTIGVGVPIPLAGSAQNPGTNLLAVLNGDYPTRDSTATIAIYGTNHTYYAIGPNWTRTVGIAGSPPAGVSLFMRFD